MGRKHSSSILLPGSFMELLTPGKYEPGAHQQKNLEIFSDDEININKIRVHYFFSENNNIEDFLKKFSANIKLFNKEKHLVAEKQYERIVMCTPKMRTMNLEV